MLVNEAMSRFPIIVSPRLPCGEALDISERNDEHFLLAVAGERLVGVARACDLRKASSYAQVLDSLRAPVLTIRDVDPVELAERMLTLISGGCLVVLDERGALVGVLTCEDLSRVGALSLPASRHHCALCGHPQHLIYRDVEEPPICCTCMEMYPLAPTDLAESQSQNVPLATTPR
jgi:hypothetical protein